MNSSGNKKNRSLGVRDSEIDPTGRNTLTVKAIDPAACLPGKEAAIQARMEREALSRRRRPPSSGGTTPRRRGTGGRRKESGGRRPSRVGWGRGRTVEGAFVLGRLGCSED